MKKSKRIINVIGLIILLGLIAFYKYKLGYIELFDRYVLGVRGWTDYYTYMYIFGGLFEMIYCLVVLCDNTKKKLPSALITVIGIGFVIRSIYINYKIVVEPVVNYDDPVIVNYRMNLIFNAVGIILTGAIFLQYIYKKKKDNFFWKYNIFLFPVVAWLFNVRWFNDFDFKGFINNYLSQIGWSSLLIMAIMFLFAFLLFNKYGNTKKEILGD